MMQLEGKRLKLRDWIEEDLEPFRHWNTGDHLWMEFNGPYYPRLNQMELATRIEFYRKKIARQDWDDLRTRLVIADISTNTLLGTVNWYWQSPETNWKSLGVALFDEAHWGKGLGYEALELWIDYLFEQDATLVRLDFRTWSGNEGMMRLAQKLGFREEARFRKARIVKDKYYDSIGLGVLREEWLARIPQELKTSEG